MVNTQLIELKNAIDLFEDNINKSEKIIIKINKKLKVGVFFTLLFLISKKFIVIKDLFIDSISIISNSLNVVGQVVVTATVTTIAGTSLIIGSFYIENKINKEETPIPVLSIPILNTPVLNTPVLNTPVLNTPVLKTTDINIQPEIKEVTFKTYSKPIASIVLINGNKLRGKILSKGNGIYIIIKKGDKRIKLKEDKIWKISY